MVGNQGRPAKRSHPHWRQWDAQHLLQSAVGAVAWNGVAAMVDLRGRQPVTGGQQGEYVVGCCCVAGESGGSGDAASHWGDDNASRKA
jgi:hypothetical protein